jgi:hypothetical protein
VKVSPDTAASLEDHRQRTLAEGHGSPVIFCNTKGRHQRAADVRKWL